MCFNAARLNVLARVASLSDRYAHAVHTALAQACPVQLKVMSFNTWGAGTNAGKSIDETVAAIRASGADIIGVQETQPEEELGNTNGPFANESAAAKLAKALGFYWHDQTRTYNAAKWANAILSRHPIEATTAHDLGVQIDVNGRRVFAFNLQLLDCPYQPFQLLGIPYCDAPFLNTAEEAVAAADATRRPAMDLLREDLEAAASADAVFVLGDLNEPSHRDWTARTAAAGRHPFAVQFPTARSVEDQGFVDTYRVAFPDEVAHPGYTWESPTENLPAPISPNICGQDDRIDYVFARGERLVVEKVEIVGEKTGAADIVVTPWPSDHRAVMATVRF
jgi:exodeoxyribonuclease-3